MKTYRAILKKIQEWEGNPMLVAGLYRLFAYLPWDLVPDKYKEFFPKDAKDTWMKDDGTYSEEELKLDVESEIRAVLNTIAKKNITNSFGIIPMIFADLYIMNKRTGALQGHLNKIINSYKYNVDLDRKLAEQLAMFEVFDLIRAIIKKAGIQKQMVFDLDKAIEQVVEASQKVENDISKAAITPEIHNKIDEALDKEKERREGEDSVDV